tara:strand:+ start:167 stop:850 length:684 start_codon:yes stop_codon:yes gene_type:complete
MKNLKQTIVNKVEALNKLDASVEKSTGKQSMSRRELAVMASLYTAKTCDLSTFNEKAKRAVNKEILDTVGKDSKKKIGQVAFNPVMLSVAKVAVDKFNSGEISEEEVLPYLESLIVQNFQKVGDEGKTTNDVSTHKGLNASLPKEDQNKASKSEKTEQDLNKQTLGDSKIFFAIIRALLEMDMSRLKKTLEFVKSLSEAPQDEIVLPASVIDQVSDKLPNAFASWMK